MDADDLMTFPTPSHNLMRQYSLNIPRSGSVQQKEVWNLRHRWQKAQMRWQKKASDSSESNIYKDEVVEVIFGEGVLGIDFAIDEATDRVVIKNCNSSRSYNQVHMLVGEELHKGLVVDAINYHQVDQMRGEEVLQLLAKTNRPMCVSFITCDSNMVVCRLCESRVEASELDSHTEICVVSIKQETSQINDKLIRIAGAIESNLKPEYLRSCFTDTDIQFYKTMRAISLQAAACEISNVNSFELCVRFMKMLDQTSHRERSTPSFIVDRGANYSSRIRYWIHAKMKEMRKTQKKLLHQSPATVYRTKSLENQDNNRMNTIVPKLSHVTIHDFEIIKPISKGAFGKVYLAKKKTTGDQYAIKVLPKEHVLRKNELSNIEAERDILASVQSPFVVKLFWTFQSPHNLFLVMEYLPGGDFMSLLECIVRLEERVACIYIAEIALALNHLHSKGCVHRDLKPDNILIGSNGHIKLTDFGLSEEGVNMNEVGHDDDKRSASDESSCHAYDEECEEVLDVNDALEVNDVFFCEADEEQVIPANEMRQEFLDAFAESPKAEVKASQFRCGTPDYLSPEILLGMKHGTPVDYWALGVILYEMLVGFPPFNDDTVEAIFANILEQRIIWPNEDQSLSPNVENLIKRLLDWNPDTRMGWNELVVHPFFKEHGIDWNTLLDATPPFVPTLDNPYDTSYFNNRNLTEAFVDGDNLDGIVPTQSIKIPTIGTPERIPSPLATPEAFRKFSFTNMYALAAAGREEAHEKIGVKDCTTTPYLSL